LLASVQITSYNSHSASFGPSAVRVNTKTVYSGRSEADLVMASTGDVGQFPHTTLSGKTVVSKLSYRCSVQR
jgi:hypothetical protein